MHFGGNVRTLKKWSQTCTQPSAYRNLISYKRPLPGGKGTDWSPVPACHRETNHPRNIKSQKPARMEWAGFDPGSSTQNQGSFGANFHGLKLKWKRSNNKTSLWVGISTPKCLQRAWMLMSMLFTGEWHRGQPHPHLTAKLMHLVNTLFELFYKINSSENTQQRICELSKQNSTDLSTARSEEPHLCETVTLVHRKLRYKPHPNMNSLNTVCSIWTLKLQ